MYKRKDGRDETKYMVRWFKDGKLHREDGPAVEFKNGYVQGVSGYKEWCVNGKRHRIDGPAVEYEYENVVHREWWINGERHRLDGPAVEWKNLSQWWINDVQLTEENFNQWIEKIILKNNLESSLKPSPPVKKGKI